MKIETLSQENQDALAQLMVELWPYSNFEDELKDAKRIYSSEGETSFLVKEGNQHVAFIYLKLRKDWVEGAKELPIAYVEGIYVKPEFQGKSIGKMLIQKAEMWAKSMGSSQLASDTEFENTGSINFHSRMGFKEENRVICFIKDLD
ncbi:aminoglycoside 6'-N-acetyltransferase [Gracilimonas sp.]|uniref:aminoglycoside 6'-N-acetyltransferase n=1 Tax=Gracilimonas sp. TaxID=1974203 RepID=UPI003BA983F1